MLLARRLDERAGGEGVRRSRAPERWLARFLAAGLAVGGCSWEAGDPNLVGPSDGHLDIADLRDTSPDDAAVEDHGGRSAFPAGLFCGNGTIETGEECDDGNPFDQDGCDWRCRRGPGDPPDDPPDPAAGHLELDVAPRIIDLGEPDMMLASMDFGIRIPLVWTGRDWATVWAHWTGIPEESPVQGTFARFDSTGGRVGATWTCTLRPYFGVAEPLAMVDLAWNGSRFGVLWSGLPGEPPEFSSAMPMFVELDADGNPLGEPTAVSGWVTRMGRIGLTPDDAGWAGIASAQGPAWQDLHLLRIDSSGRLRDPAPVRLLDDPGPAIGAIAWSGEAYVVTGEWYYTVFIEGLGSLPVPISLWSADQTVDVVWTGVEFGIAWFALPPLGRPEGLFLGRLSTAGELLGPPRRLDESLDIGTWDEGDEIALAWGSDSYVVAWSAPYNVHVVRADRAGTFLEHVTTPPPEGTMALSPSGVGVAADDTGFGVLVANDWGRPVFYHYRVVR
jgi:cysteine-rich repeat protein